MPSIWQADRPTRIILDGASSTTNLIDALANAAPVMFATLTRTERKKLELANDPKEFAAEKSKLAAR
jgi:hypothetical protein